MSDERKYESHESYATIAVSRTTGGSKRALFGSNLKHGESIYIRLSHAELERHSNRDWIHPDKVIAEVEMSFSQFAEMMTSLNQGEGVPCTLRYLNGKTIAPPPHEDKSEVHRREFAEHQTEIQKRADNTLQLAKELLSKKTLTKADKEAIINSLKRLSMDIGPNTSYQTKVFDEYMAETVTQAKGEIEAFMQNKLIAIGNQTLVENGDHLRINTNCVDLIEDTNGSEPPEN